MSNIVQAVDLVKKTIITLTASKGLELLDQFVIIVHLKYSKINKNNK